MKHRPKRIDWKSRALASEAELAALRMAVLAKDNQITYLVKTIRETDQIIFSMGQAVDGRWETVRSRFSQLHDQMTARKVAESNRINDLITDQLRTVYSDESAALKQITKG